jgi:hypothetical protein
MAEAKYAKYVIGNLKPSGENLVKQHQGNRINSFIWSETWYPETKVWVEMDLIYQPWGVMGGGVQVSNKVSGEDVFKLSTHKHTCDELFLYFGTNPKDPESLGGEYEFYLGGGEEAERYVFTKNTGIYVPAGVNHNPNRATRVDNPDQPIVMCVVLLSPRHGPTVTEWLLDDAGNVVNPPGFELKIPAKG